MNTLTDQNQAETLISSPAPAWILKHSNACPVSFAAHDEMADFLAMHPAPHGIVVVQTHRPLSNWLSTRLGFVHQSPQLFLVRDGKVLWQASHWGITTAAMHQALTGAL